MTRAATVLATVATALVLAGPGAGVAGAAQAQITAAPPAETTETTAVFEFQATGMTLLSHFECRLDGGPWERCRSPRRYDGLLGGPHSFDVRLVGPLDDPRPDRHTWTILQQSELLPPPPPPPPLPPPQPPTPPEQPPARRIDAGGCAYGGNRAHTVAQRLAARAVVCLVNRERAKRDLRRLRHSSRLARAARAHAADMVDGGYFAHESRTGDTAVDRIRRTGYLRGASAWSVGEVLAWGSGRRSTPDATVRAWMRSRGHRTVLLMPAFRDLGIGVARGLPAPGDAAGATVVGELGRRR